jgi:hypothetical protein
MTWEGWNFQLDGMWEGKDDGIGSEFAGDWNRGVTVAGVDMDVWPNPAAEVAFLELAAGCSALEVFQMNGTRVFAEQFAEVNQVALQLGQWKAGTYIVRIQTGDGVRVQKLLQVVR